MAEDLTIEVISTESAASSAVERLLHQEHRLANVFGLDCEWDVMHEKGAVAKPDLLQIATADGYCALFRLNLLRNVPLHVKKLLEDPFYTKVGVAIMDDTQKLLHSYGVNTKGVVDVRYLADEEGMNPSGLSGLTAHVLGVPCKKQPFTFHCWSGWLSKAQKTYAAADAVFGVRIFDRLNHTRICNMWGSEWKGWSRLKYHTHTLALWDKYYDQQFNYGKSRFVIKSIVDNMLRLG